MIPMNRQMQNGFNEKFGDLSVVPLITLLVILALILLLSNNKEEKETTEQKDFVVQEVEK